MPERNTMRKFLSVIDSINEWTGKIMAYFLIPLVLLMVFEVVMRYAFNNPTNFSYDTSIFMYGAIGILAGGYVLKHRAHVYLDIFYRRLSPRGKAIIDLVSALLFFYFLGVLLVHGWELGLFAYQIGQRTSTPWGPILWPFKMLIPLASVLLVLQGIAKFIRDFYFSLYGKELS